LRTSRGPGLRSPSARNSLWIQVAQPGVQLAGGVEDPVGIVRQAPVRTHLLMDRDLIEEATE